MEDNMNDRCNDRNDNVSKIQIVNIANEVLGEQTWSYAVTNETIDFIEENDQSYSVGVAAFVKVQIENGIYREELGYSIADKPTKGGAIYEARRNAILNGLFESLIAFGGVLAKRLQENQSKPSISPGKLKPENVPETNPAQVGSLVLEADMFTQDFNSNSIVGKAVVKIEKNKTPTKPSPLLQRQNNEIDKQLLVNIKEPSKAGKSVNPPIITSTPFASSETRTIPVKNLFISELPKPAVNPPVNLLIPNIDDKARAERLKRQRELKEEFLRKKVKL